MRATRPVRFDSNLNENKHLGIPIVKLAKNQ